MDNTQPPINAVAALDAAIADYDRVDLMSAVAGLQLLPVNVSGSFALRRLAHRIACGKTSRARRIAPHTLRATLQFS